MGSRLIEKIRADTDLADSGRDPRDSLNGRLHFCRIFTDTFVGIAPQSTLIFILTHLTTATLVTLTHRLLAASNPSP